MACSLHAETSKLQKLARRRLLVADSHGVHDSCDVLSARRATNADSHPTHESGQQGSAKTLPKKSTHPFLLGVRLPSLSTFSHSSAGLLSHRSTLSTRKRSTPSESCCRQTFRWFQACGRNTPSVEYLPRLHRAKTAARWGQDDINKSVPANQNKPATATYLV